MTWFKVDDGLHSHPKALATSLEALGLWAVAGSWSSQHLTDGVVPQHAVTLLSRGQSELADELVAAGLWKRVRDGYRFHDWKDRNPTRAEVQDLRRTRVAAGRKGGLTRTSMASKRQANTQANAKQNSSKGGTTPDPSRPVVDSSTRGLTSTGSEGEADPKRNLDGVTAARKAAQHRASKPRGGHHGEGT